MKVAFYDTKPYDRIWFDPLLSEYGYQAKFFDYKLTADTAVLAKGCDAVCVFVNDEVDAAVIDALCANGVGLIALRCSGYNNVDLAAARDKIRVVRVPRYSPDAVAEYAMALLLTVNRKTHRAYVRTRDNNFNINGLLGMDLAGKTAGVIGTGQIGSLFADICNGFLDHGNYIAYGYASVVLCGLGISFAMPVLHGKTRRGALVFDLADLIKDAWVMPLAFECAGEGTAAQQFRQRLIETCQEREVLDFLFDFMEDACKKE